MFAAVRRYAGLDSTSIEDLEFHTESISRVLTSVPGSAGCEVIETREGVLVVSIGVDEAAVEEAGRRFALWLDRHLPVFRETNPDVWAGKVLIHAATATSAEGDRS
jgi:hypothetical protein